MPPNEDYSLRETKPNIGEGTVSASHKLTLVEQQFYLYVKVVAAGNLPKNNLTGTCDPFVELKIGNYKAITRCLVNTSDPVWNQMFAFTQERLQGKVLEIFVRDNAAVLNDQVVGRILVAVGDAPTRLAWDSPLAPQWYRLEDPDGNIVGGELMLAIWVGNQADEAFSVAWHSDAASVSGESVPNTRSKIYYSPRLWYLRVTVMEAQDLVPSHQNRKPEVYIKARLGGLVLRTRVSSNKSVNPCWNEELMFVAAEPFDDALILSVEDKIGDKEEECLGRCVLPLQKVDKRLLPPPPSDKWINLERHVPVENGSQDVKFASKLHLTVFLDGVYHVFDEPAYYSSDLIATSPNLKPGEIGVLELGILKAEGLAPMKSKDGCETTDAYCVAKYGPKWARTSTVISSLAPKWNEQYKWEVYDPCTVITIGVFDNSNLRGRRASAAKRDSVIGKVRILLSTLETNRIYAHAYPLLVLKANGLKKMGELHLVVRFTCISAVNLLYSYTQPLLPTTQYLSPLSVYQTNNLRHQAVGLICLRLGRADPPLRKEVVEYMLDAKMRKWSIRRAKANYERVMRCLLGFIEIWKWFDDVRQWKNTLTTVVIWFLFIFLVTFPHVILPSAFFYLAFLGIWNYRERPRHPSFIDARLSHAENVGNRHDLDEEFDTIPSSMPVEVVMMRYDRLRSIGERITTTLGDLATQLERVHSVVSWRDPRATPMFVLFCLITGVVIYTSPFQWLLIAAGTYAMRPPRLRVTLPSILQNFLRRMPAKEDCML